MSEVVCIGHATLDAIAVVDRLPGSDTREPASDARLAGGGVAATAAVALARLGVPVAFVGRVGDDEVGLAIRDGLRAEGVDTEHVQVIPGARSPLSIVLVERPTGARSLVPSMGALPPIELDAAARDRCRAAAWVHLDYVGAGVLADVTALGGPRVSVDDGVPIPDLLLGRVDLYGPTVASLLARFPAPDLETAMRAAIAAGARMVVATRGADGALALAAGDEAPVAVDAVDPGGPIVSTLGAGDVFHGALLAGLLESGRLDLATRWAATAAALACRSLDGRSAIPDRSTLLAHLGMPDA